MSPRVLVDTGPLVAILSRRDQYHQVCVEQLRELAPPLWTCWPVMTEAVWLLRHQPLAVTRLLEGFDAGLFKLLPLDDDTVSWIRKFLQRHRRLGAQLADASLAYLAQREGIDTVFTLDQRDFSVYRLSGNRSLNLLPLL